jgi:hypothetical protein
MDDDTSSLHVAPRNCKDCPSACTGIRVSVVPTYSNEHTPRVNVLLLMHGYGSDFLLVIGPNATSFADGDGTAESERRLGHSQSVYLSTPNYSTIVSRNYSN